MLTTAFCIAASNIPAFSLLIASNIIDGVSAPDGFTDTQQKWAKECAEDLKSNSGASLVVAGAHLPVEVHKLVLAINEKLDAIGKTIDYVEVPQVASSSIEELAAELTSGNSKIKTLFILGGNPG